MLQKLSTQKHWQPYKGPFTITRIQPGDILEENEDFAFGPLSIIDHAVMKKGLTIKMHEHVNDEILSYVWHGKMHHKDSAGLEAPITPGHLMMMNAGQSFWHEEKVKNDQVEMLQIFVRPHATNLEPTIQFHEKPIRNRNWYLMVGPEGSQAPLKVRQEVYILDAHPKQGDQLDVPVYQGLQPFLYVLDGELTVGDVQIQKMEAVTDIEAPLPPITAVADTTVVLFFADMNAPVSMEGTISGKRAY
ncbi:pirin family protein [Fredinandcohnia sp. QZ13]|uniref:pirin family protein n=1 Tax=Fredinandcohnia sp. QZ13 TaxID=3073144 RepID=UPI00285357EF|nr:pirin family protein [Fredinandcohnia sp. QZ13]MDR4887347.1 pirin family protein [Fredinandcohnia sp. QZ13]